MTNRIRDRVDHGCTRADRARFVHGRFGGLARYLPITFGTFGLGYLALIGFPFLSGYFSKDRIIEAAFGQPGWQGWVFGGLATLAAGLTAFYMTRLMLMTFFGEKRWESLTTRAIGDVPAGEHYHPHEAPPIMTVPMIVFTSAKIAATTSRVMTNCSVSPGGNAMTETCSAGIRVTTQIANALTTTRMMKRIVSTSLARATDAGEVGATRTAWRPSTGCPRQVGHRLRSAATSRPPIDSAG